MFFSFDIFGWFSFVRIQVYGVEPAESAVLNGGKPGQYNVSYTLFTWFCLGTVAFFHVSG